METLLLAMAFIIFLYAIAVVATVSYDLATGRYKRLQSMRTAINEAQIELEERRGRSSKFWEVVDNE